MRASRIFTDKQSADSPADHIVLPGEDVRPFLDALAEAVARSVLADLVLDEAASAESPKSAQRRGCDSSTETAMKPKPGGLQVPQPLAREKDMKSKPDRKNLTKRGGVIYYQRVVDGRRLRFSCETGDWEEAARVRDLYEARRRIGTRHPIIVECPRFAELAKQYLEAEKRRAQSDGEGLARFAGGQ